MQYSPSASQLNPAIPPQKLKADTGKSANSVLKSGCSEGGRSAYPLDTAQRGSGSEMQMALDGQGRTQVGFGGGGRRAAPAREAARAIYAAVLKAFILLRVVT